MTSDTITHRFTFGQNHMSSYPLPSGGGRLADYWVEVTLPRTYRMAHREVFIDMFTRNYCPRPDQWAFEYGPNDVWKPEYFKGGVLCRVTETGVFKPEKEDTGNQGYFDNEPEDSDPLGAWHGRNE